MTTKPWPWNKVKDPIPADWGVDMTVCIAAICEPVLGDEYIVAASDRMVSMSGYFSGDDAVRKVDPVAYGWSSMIAGNDVSPAVPILARINAGGFEENQSNMVNAFRNAFKAQRLEQIEEEILSPIGFTWETFLRDAKTQLSDSAYERILERIGRYELDLVFLVSGFDTAGKSHIFTISNPGKCDYYEKIGFWAIGSGQHQALASMFTSKYMRFAPLENCIARVFTAKMAAESASGVGKTTWLTVATAKERRASIFISRETMDQFRDEWNQLPKFPAKAMEAIRANLDSERKRLEEKFMDKKSPD